LENEAEPEITIRPLSGENRSDWLDFFDNRAFEDHRDWKTCYCTFFHYPRDEAYRGASRRKRDYALWLLEQGKMGGYLAYRGDRAVGFCNADLRENYPRLKGGGPGKVLSVVCFIIAKEERGKGVATRLLERVIEDGKARKLDMVEAYPVEGKSEYGHFHGPPGLYGKFGFTEEKTRSGRVMRKYLDSGIILRTERLILRFQRESDVPFLVRLWTDEEVTRYVGGPRDRKKMEEVFRGIARNPREEEYDLWPLEVAETGELAGYAGLIPKEIGGEACMELNYYLAGEFRGRGYAGEIARALVDYGLGEKGLRGIAAVIDPNNRASAEVARKCSLTFRFRENRGGGEKDIYAVGEISSGT